LSIIVGGKSVKMAREGNLRKNLRKNLKKNLRVNLRVNSTKNPYANLPRKLAKSVPLGDILTLTLQLKIIHNIFFLVINKCLMNYLQPLP
jgi:hypothetical protein